MSSKSNYPSDALWSGLSIKHCLNRDGLIADCIAPLVVTSCDYKWINWDRSESGLNSSLDNLKGVDGSIGCYSKPKELDPSSFVYDRFETSEKAVSIPLKECCFQTCGDVTFDVEAAKINEVTDRLLISRELEAMKLLDESNTAIWTPSSTAIVDGVLDTSTTSAVEGAHLDLNQLTGYAGIEDASFNALKFFQNIQADALKTGARNWMAMNRKTALALLRNQTIIGQGCQTVPQSTLGQLENLLGVNICIAEAVYNAAPFGQAPALQKLLDNKILMFVRNETFGRADACSRTFAFSAHTAEKAPARVRTYFDNEMGASGGMKAVVYHDATVTLADSASGTLITI